MDKIYIIHEYGAPTHFYALDCLLRSKGIHSVKYELNIYGQMKKAVKKLSFRSFLRMWHNIGFLLSLPFLKPSKVVLGLAPYHWCLVPLLPFLKRHKVFYFTSFICWDGSRQVHHAGPRIVGLWHDFLIHHVAHIFAVSQRSRSELIRNGLSSESGVTVVGHSYITRPEVSKCHRKDNRFIYVGDLKPIKGIEELLACFRARPDAHLTIIGKGPLEDYVKGVESSCPNIHYVGYISDQQVLFRHYMDHSFFILNSKRTANSEELFGMVLIEASACGLVPLSANHSGPKEIISNDVNGILFEEGKLSSAIDECMTWSEERYERIRTAAIENGRQYYVDKMASRWSSVLE